MIGAFVQLNLDSPKGRHSPIGYVVCEDGCWEWVGERSCGYGKLGRNGKKLWAHRWVYELTNGPIPPDHELDHLCRNPACVRPDHLEPVTHRINMLRAPTSRTAINASRTHCPRGHPYQGDNLVRAKLRKGHRECLVCTKARKNRAYRVRHPVPA